MGRKKTTEEKEGDQPTLALWGGVVSFGRSALCRPRACGAVASPAPESRPGERRKYADWGSALQCQGPRVPQAAATPRLLCQLNRLPLPFSKGHPPVHQRYISVQSSMHTAP